MGRSLGDSRGRGVGLRGRGFCLVDGGFVKLCDGFNYLRLS